MTNPPTGVTIDTASGAIMVPSTLAAGTYHLTATAADSATVDDQLLGTMTFDILVAMNVTNTSPVTGTNGQASTITTDLSRAGPARRSTPWTPRAVASPAVTSSP